MFGTMNHQHRQFIYHERQESSLCGQHCLNNLLQGPYFSALDLASIAEELDQQERLLSGDLIRERNANVDDSGNFSVQVLRAAVGQFNNIELSIWHTSTGVIKALDQCDGFIVNRSSHWLAVRKVHGKWWNLNSTLERPEPISDFYLSAFLAQLTADGFQVFVVEGKIPACGDPNEFGDAPTHILGGWYTVDDLLSGPADQPQSTTATGFKAFQGKSHRLGQTEEIDPLVQAALNDEDLELAKAISMSLQPTNVDAKSRAEEMRAKRLAAFEKK